MTKRAWSEAYRWFGAAMAFVCVGCLIYGHAWRFASKPQVAFMIVFVLLAGVQDVEKALAHRKARKP